MPTARAALASISVTTILLFAASSALAAPSAKDKAEAKTLVNEAKRAVKDKRWADAVTALKKADGLDPSAALELELAEAQIGAGKLVEAGKTLSAIEAGSDTSAAGKKAREAAKKKLAELKDRTPKLQVVVKGPAAGAKVTLDGSAIDAPGEVPVDPGHHTVAASADGFKPKEKAISLAEGERMSVDLALEASPPPEAKKDVEKKGSRLPGIVVASVGGAALVTGGIFGGLALSATSKAKSQCSGNDCPLTAKSDIDRSKLFGNVSTGLIISGGAVAAAGVVLAIMAPFGKKADDAPKSGRIVPWVGADQVGVAGTF